MTLVALLEYASVLIFAITGALVASRAQLDIVGFAFLACLTALGGGTVRDLLLDRNPIFWINAPSFLATACAAAFVVFFTAHLLESRYRTLIWLDSFALSVAVAAGAGAALAMDQTPVIVVLMGMITSSMGGLMRDMVVGQVPLILKQGELYASAALAGATTAALMHPYTPEYSLIACAVVTWVLRAGSIFFGWHLPIYRNAPPKE